MNPNYLDNSLNVMRGLGMSSQMTDYVKECLEGGTEPEMNGKDGQVYQKFAAIMGKA